MGGKNAPGISRIVAYRYLRRALSDVEELVAGSCLRGISSRSTWEAPRQWDGHDAARMLARGSQNKLDSYNGRVKSGLIPAQRSPVRHGVVFRSFAATTVSQRSRMAGTGWQSRHTMNTENYSMASLIHTSVCREDPSLEEHKGSSPSSNIRASVLPTSPVGKQEQALLKSNISSNDVYADAEECDEAIEDLENVRKRVQSWKKLPPGHVPMSVRIKNMSMALANGTKTVLLYTISIPGKIIKFYSLPRAERKATYSRWWGVVKSEAKHYWLGLKLLGKDTKIASRLLGKVLAGKALSRRERQQLTRTTADIFRLVPMMVFLVVPFMELLLPVALKLFPNMLPSTFEDKLKKEEELKKRVGARLEIARFLQDTVAEMAGDMTAHRSGDTKTSAAELYGFMQRVRAGEHVETSELLKFAKLFNDELTLDNLERVQLVSLCRFVGISPFGTDAFLKTRLRSHLIEIKNDDREIEEEGIENLTEDELRQACRARGMRAPFGEGATKFMRQQLAEWLDWSLNRSLPSSLLLLSRAFTVTSPIGQPSSVDVSSIRETLSTMPEEVVEDVELFATSSADKSEEYERKLELLEREEELIREEQECEMDLNLPAMPKTGTVAEKAATAAAAAVVKEAAVSSLADVLDRESMEEKSFKAAAAKEAKMHKIVNALAALASSSGVISEREAFMDLVEKEIERLRSSMGNQGTGMVFTKGQLNVDRGRIEEALGKRRLEDRVTSILKRVERDLDLAESRIGDNLKLLDLDGDGIISPEELKLALSFLKERLGDDELQNFIDSISEGGAISTSELLRAAYESDDDEPANKS